MKLPPLPRPRRATLVTAALLAAGALGLALGAWMAAPPVEPEPPAGGSAPSDAGGGGAAAEDATVWTCSMHPQVRLPEAGPCPICGMDLIPVTAGAAADAPRVTLSPAARALAALEVVPVERRPVAVDLRLVGRVTYDETRLARITAWFGGRIERLFVDYAGTRVEKGDHLFELYSPELLVAQQDLIQAAREASRLAGAGPALREGAEETLGAAREKLKLWGLQGWQIASVLKRGRPLRTVTLYAPIGGIVTEKATLQGSYVQTGTPVYTIADLSQVWVVLEAYETDLPWVRYGQDVAFEVAAFPGRTFHGTVTFVSPTVDPRTRTIAVRLNVPNPGLDLKPDMFVRARLRSVIGRDADLRPAATMAGRWICPMHPEEVADGPGRCGVCGMKLVPAEEHWLVGEAMARDRGREPPPLVIPATAPLLTGKRAVVFVEDPEAPEPTYALREVTLGPRAGDWYVVAEGLAEGERVVSEGAFKLDSALQIRGDRSMMSLPPPEAPVEAPLAAVARTLDAVLAASEGGRRAPPGGALDALEAAVDADEAGAAAHALVGPARWLRVARTEEEREAALALLGAVAARVPGLAAGPHPAPALAEAPPAFAEALGKVAEAARDVSAALAADDAAAAREAAAALPGAARALEDAAPGPVDPGLRRGAEALAVAEAPLPALRAALLDLSTALVPLVIARRSEIGGRVQPTYCPMASDNQGALWLQAPGDVANPYFGASMLRCGEALPAGDAGDGAAGDGDAGDGGAGDGGGEEGP